MRGDSEVAGRKERFSTVDLFWTEDGDFEVTAGGDLADTASSITRALKQEIRTVLLARRGDWPTEPRLGANLEEFIGEANDMRLAQKVGSSIVRGLVEPRILNPEDFAVLPTPIEDYMLVRITAATPVKDLTIHLGLDSKNKRLMSF